MNAKAITRVTVNMLIMGVMFAVVGMNHSATVEHRASVLASDEQARQAQAQENDRQGRVVFKEMTKGMSCVGADKPFLTDKIIVSDDMPNMEWVTFDEALHIQQDRGKGWVVLAYCK